MKKLRIKAGVVKRLVREYRSYENEVRKEKDRLLQWKEGGESEAKLRKQEEILQETIQMIPDTRRRLQEAYTTLRDAMKELDSNQEILQSELWTEAEANATLAQDIVVT